jgi:hypothetical protein
VDAAGIVAEHAAERAAVVRGWVGSEGEVVALRRGAQVVEHDARLDTRQLAVGIDFEYLVQVFGEVQDDGGVAALAREAGAAATVEQRRSIGATERHRRQHVIGRARHDHANRWLPVV